MQVIGPGYQRGQAPGALAFNSGNSFSVCAFDAYFLAKPIRKRISVLPMTARYNWKISLELLRVKAISITATHMNRMVKKIEMYFIYSSI